MTNVQNRALEPAKIKLCENLRDLREKILAICGKQFFGNNFLPSLSSIACMSAIPSLTFWRKLFVLFFGIFVFKESLEAVEKPEPVLPDQFWHDSFLECPHVIASVQPIEIVRIQLKNFQCIQP